jgi:hypothetical protein
MLLGKSRKPHIFLQNTKLCLPKKIGKTIFVVLARKSYSAGKTYRLKVLSAQNNRDVTVFFHGKKYSKIIFTKKIRKFFFPCFLVWGQLGKSLGNFGYIN